MADITQKLSIDVSGAVQALDQLDKKLASFGTSLDGLADKFSSFNASAKNAFKIGDAVKPTEDAAQRAKRAFDALFETQTKAAKGGQAVAAGANKAATGLTKVRTAATGAQSALQRIGAIGGNAFKGIFGSLANLTRIIGTRVLIQGFGALQRAISGSIQSASELSQKIREVGTILPTTEANAKNLTEQVRKLSDTFNLPINAVTEGLYQTISNQIGDVSESLAFLGTASKFAKVAVTDIDTAVSLLSGTLNAFGLAARDTEAIADKLFKTIELGRTRASELANSLGRVLPVAKELGVSLDEVLAGFATVTIAGIKTSEATTQLRGAFNSILKPTEAMKDLLAELGFESGEAFIQAKGLQGAFATIREAAGGSIQALSKFIPRVRGMNAALILGASGAERFQENLKKIRDEASGIIEAKFEFVVEAEAEQLANTVNRIKNLFTVELGNSIISTLAKMTSFIGGLDNVSAAMKTLVPVATALAISIAAIGTALFVGNAAYGAAVALAAGLTISLGALAAVAALVLAPLAALIALDFAENKRIASINAEIAAIKERNEQELAFEKKQNAAVLAIRSARLRELNSVIQEEIAAFNKGFKQRVSEASG
jgi:TP901 family phage tail tape measure protein